MPLALYALAIGGFGIGLTEFVILGLLPEVGADFGVTPTVAGYLISGYALAVAVGAIGLTALLNGVDRKRALLLLMVLFIAGNLTSALAPTYEVMLAGRILAALCHGAFFGIGAVLAAALVPANRKAAAISIMFAGLTTATVLGVPFGTFLGQAFGWRSTFWAITLIGVIAFVGIASLVPARGRDAAHARGAVPGGTGDAVGTSGTSGTSDAGDAESVSGRGGTSGLRAEFAAFGNAQVWLSLIATIFGYGGMFGGFTYIAFTLTEVSGFASSTVPWLLVLFGAGLFAGNILGGRAADRNLGLTLVTLFGLLTLVLAAFALVAHLKWAALAALMLMGFFGFATVPALQMRIMGFADRAPSLASGANIAAFNIGNALGAWAGGLGLAAGLGYTSPLWVGALLTLGGLAFIVAAVRMRGGEFARPAPAPEAVRAG